MILISQILVKTYSKTFVALYREAFVLIKIQLGTTLITKERYCFLKLSDDFLTVTV